MLLRRGDIALLNFDPAEPFEAAKTRPAVIVSNNISNEHAHVVTIVPLTTNLTRVYPHEFVIPVERSNLESDSKTQVHLLRHVSKKRIQKVIASLPSDLMAKLDDLLREQVAL